MDRHQEAFLEMLAAERGAARNTLMAYARDLEDFAAFAASRGQKVAGADAATLQAYMASLPAQGLAARTAARRLSALRRVERMKSAGGSVSASTASLMARGSPNRWPWPMATSSSRISTT